MLRQIQACNLVSRFQFVADHRDAFGVKRLCSLLKRAADAVLTRRIRTIHAASGKTYGAKRVTTELRESGLHVNRKRIERLMRQHAIAGRRLRKRHRTTIPDPDRQPVPDLLRRTFTAPAPNTVWIGDITYLPIAGGRFLYLAAALRTRGGGVDGVIFHSDHGAQYGSKAFVDACRTAGIRRSMGAVGSSADNAAAESFFASLKQEILPGRRGWPT